jgi:hypothetical protein
MGAHVRPYSATVRLTVRAVGNTLIAFGDVPRAHGIACAIGLTLRKKLRPEQPVWMLWSKSQTEVSIAFGFSPVVDRWIQNKSTSLWFQRGSGRRQSSISGRAQAGGPDGGKAADALSAIEQAMAAPSNSTSSAMTRRRSAARAALSRGVVPRVYHLVNVPLLFPSGPTSPRVEPPLDAFNA